MLHMMKEYKIYIITGLVACIVAIYFIFQPDENEAVMFEENALLVTNEQNAEGSNHALSTPDETVFVDVKGAVQKPGVYEAKVNDRVIDLINIAGGLSDSADEARINFAMRVEDEMVIYVPIKGEETEGIEVFSSGGSHQGITQATKDGKVNINLASETELQALTGIGPAKAAAIIEYRETNGPFKVIEDLKSISGIGDKTFEKLKDSIKVR